MHKEIINLVENGKTLLTILTKKKLIQHKNLLKQNHGFDLFGVFTQSMTINIAIHCKIINLGQQLHTINSN